MNEGQVASSAGDFGYSIRRNLDRRRSVAIEFRRWFFCQERKGSLIDLRYILERDYYYD